ncbi:hypothetical protein V3C99_018685 [Haemonchus contortus]
MLRIRVLDQYIPRPANISNTTKTSAVYTETTNIHYHSIILCIALTASGWSVECSLRRHQLASEMGNTVLNGDSLETVDFSTFSASDLLKSIAARNTDPVINKMLIALKDKLSVEVFDVVSEEKRGRSIVISGLPESNISMKPSEKQRELENKIPDFVFITETWLNENIKDSEIVGGFPYTIMSQKFFGAVTKSDYICFDYLNDPSVRNIRFILVYRPPNSCYNDDRKLLDLLATMCSSSAHLIILGDFNLDIDWKQDYMPVKNPHSSKMHNSFFCRTARWLQMLPEEIISFAAFIFSLLLL